MFLTLAEGTENALADGETYAAEGDANACVWAECDLTINGSGKLKVQGNDKRGISSKDELIITGGDIAVNAVDDGLRGKDGVGICGGTIDITGAATASRPTRKTLKARAGSPSTAVVTVNAEQDGLAGGKRLAGHGRHAERHGGAAAKRGKRHGRGDWGGFLRRRWRRRQKDAA